MPKEIDFNAYRGKLRLYRLEGVRYPDGSVSLQDRPFSRNGHSKNGHSENGNRAEIIYKAPETAPAPATD